MGIPAFLYFLCIFFGKLVTSEGMSRQPSPQNHEPKGAYFYGNRKKRTGHNRFR